MTVRCAYDLKPSTTISLICMMTLQCLRDNLRYWCVQTNYERTKMMSSTAMDPCKRRLCCYDDCVLPLPLVNNVWVVVGGVRHFTSHTRLIWFRSRKLALVEVVSSSFEILTDLHAASSNDFDDEGNPHPPLTTIFPHHRLLTENGNQCSPSRQWLHVIRPRVSRMAMQVRRWED